MSAAASEAKTAFLAELGRLLELCDRPGRPAAAVEAARREVEARLGDYLDEVFARPSSQRGDPS